MSLWFIINFCEIAVVHATDCIVQRSKAKTSKLQISTPWTDPILDRSSTNYTVTTRYADPI